METISTSRVAWGEEDEKDGSFPVYEAVVERGPLPADPALLVVGTGHGALLVQAALAQRGPDAAGNSRVAPRVAHWTGGAGGDVAPAGAVGAAAAPGVDGAFAVAPSRSAPGVVAAWQERPLTDPTAAQAVPVARRLMACCPRCVPAARPLVAANAHADCAPLPLARAVVVVTSVSGPRLGLRGPGPYMLATTAAAAAVTTRQKASLVAAGPVLPPPAMLDGVPASILTQVCAPQRSLPSSPLPPWSPSAHSVLSCQCEAQGIPCVAVVLPVALRPDAGALAAVMPRVAAAATAATAGQGDDAPSDVGEAAGSTQELRRELGRLSADAAADSALMSSTIFS